MAESTPQNQSSLPTRASNRPSNYNQVREQLIGSNSGDDILNRLEGTPSIKRGSRKQPSVMKYPNDIGSSQVPHVMQFKIFWRWERPDLKNSRESAKGESAKTSEYLKNLSAYGTDESGNFSVEEFLNSPYGNQLPFLNEIVKRNSLGTLVDQNGRSSVSGLLKSDPRAAKAIIEEVIKTEQSRVETIDQYGEELTGRVSISEDERLAERAGLNEEIANLNTTEAAARAGGAAFLTSFLSKAGEILNTARTQGSGAAWSRAGREATKSVMVGAGAAAVTGIGVAALKYGQAAPVYDQMVSIYLPTCTKINQQDTFVYNQPSMSVAGGMADLLGGPMGETVKQAALGLATNLAETKGLGAAVGSISGRVLNPRLEKLFKEKNIREFTFSWDFYPRNAEEVANIKDIIDTFRYHSHPALSKSDDAGKDASKEEAVASTKIMLRVPAEFEIRFLSSSNSPGSVGYEENPYIPKIGRCVISNITVDYTPNGLSTFQDNSPTATTLTITVSEVTQMTRETVEKGF